MLFRAEIFDITNDPIAVGLLGAVRVMMITKYLPDLVHKLFAGIGSKFFLFSMISRKYHNTWKIIHDIGTIYEKFFHIS